MSDRDQKEKLIFIDKKAKKKIVFKKKIVEINKSLSKF